MGCEVSKAVLRLATDGPKVSVQPCWLSALDTLQSRLCNMDSKDDQHETCMTPDSEFTSHSSNWKHALHSN
ncbi:hypothetical protein Ciccas_010490 [Cichlidogyrus casuarinus]|uniref:Uncharacterized protein n=1 Tax=Cichlidogyrus casuarinus TaxID=1844966 RepID=A0ABD2PTY1_9PLAT